MSPGVARSMVGMAMRTYTKPDPDHPCPVCDGDSVVVIQTMMAWGRDNEPPNAFGS
jgi:hypothetical protein